MSDLPNSGVFRGVSLEEARQQLEARGLRLGMALESALSSNQLRKRKHRLLACLCCRALWDQLEDERSRRAVEVAERFADGLESQETLQSIRVEAFFASRAVKTEAARAAYFATIDDAERAAENATHCVCVYYHLGDQVAQWRQDLFGNPSRSLAVDPAWASWNDGTIPRIARTICDEGRFEDLPILADALEDAGCTDQTILGHCRGPGPHFRGCWLVDLLLEKD